MNDREIAYLVGVILGFLGGVSLTLAICMDYGNAFPNWH